MENTYLAFTIQVFAERLPNGTLTDYAEVKVIADTEEEALKKAEKIYKRDKYTYRVKVIDEYEKIAKDK